MDINKHPEEDDDGNGTRKNPPLSKRANKATEEDEGDGTKRNIDEDDDDTEADESSAQTKRSKRGDGTIDKIQLVLKASLESSYGDVPHFHSLVSNIERYVLRRERAYVVVPNIIKSNFYSNPLLSLINMTDAKETFGEDMGNMLLLLAVSHGCVLECDEVVKVALQTTGTLPEYFKAIMNKVFHPLKSCGGMNWSTINQLDDRAKIEKLKEKKGYDDKEKTSRKLMATSMAFIGFSPNVLPLFLERTILPRVALASPAINNRVLHYKRIWQNEIPEIGEDAGMIGTLLGLGGHTQTHDFSFSELEYHVFVYKVSELENETTKDSMQEELVMSEYVFSQEKDSKTTHMVKHVTIDDLKNLLKLLKQVRS